MELRARHFPWEQKGARRASSPREGSSWWPLWQDEIVVPGWFVPPPSLQRRKDSTGSSMGSQTARENQTRTSDQCGKQNGIGKVFRMFLR